MGTRGRLAALAALVALEGLALGGCGTAGPSDLAAPPTPTGPPRTVADLPEGEATLYPTLADGELRIGDRSWPIEADRLVFRGGTTLVGLADERRSRWWLLAGDRLVPLLDDETAYVDPVLSADGATVAWLRVVTSSRVDDFTTHDVWEVVALDVPTRAVLGRTRLEGDVVCCDQGGMLRVAGVANDGRVSLAEGPAHGLTTWRPGDAPITVIHQDAQDVAGDSWPLGVSYLLPRDSGEKVRFGRLDERGVVTELGRVPQLGLWSADGRLFAQERWDTTGRVLEVLQPVAGGVTVLQLPTRTDWQLLAWEDDTHVLAGWRRDVDTGPPSYRVIVRCDALTGSCEIAGRAADGAL